MGTNQDAIEEINQAIAKLAKASADEDLAAAYTLQLAQAVAQLAEAQAWLRSANQPHGGSVVVSD